MNRLKKYALIILTFFMFALNISAADISTSIAGPDNINAGQTFSLTIKATGSNVWGMTMGLDYDSNKLELVKNEAKSGFTATVGKNIVLDSTSGHNGSFEIIVLTFKAKGSFSPGQSTTVSLTNVKGSSDAAVMSGTGSSKTIKVNVPKSTNNNLASLSVDGSVINNFRPATTTYDIGTVSKDKSSINITAVADDTKATITGTGTKTLKYGSNTFKIVVKAENGSTKTYQIKVNRTDPRSKDNTLSSLSISPLTISFNKNTMSYTAIAEHNVKSINIQATPTDTKATVSGTGTKTLKDYVNTFKVVVKAENETTKTYTITVNRKDSEGVLGNVSKDNTLKSLSIEGQTIKFDKNTLEYNIEVDSQVTSLNIKAVANHAKAQVKIENNEKLVMGNNTININVTAESGAKKTYKINVLRKNNIPTTTIPKLNETIDKIENDKLIVEIKDENNILTQENMSKIKSSKKDVSINKYNEDNKILYSFEVSGENLETVSELNTGIRFYSVKEDKINQLTNYSEAIFMDFDSNDNFSNGVKIKVYVGDKYKDNQLVNVYQYNEVTNKMDEIETEVQVSNGFAEITVKNPKDTIITRAKLASSVAGAVTLPKDDKTFKIVAIVEGVAIIGLLALTFLKPKKQPNFENEFNASHMHQPVIQVQPQQPINNVYVQQPVSNVNVQQPVSNVNVQQPVGHVTPTFITSLPPEPVEVKAPVKQEIEIDVPEVEGSISNTYEEQLKAQQASLNSMGQTNNNQ